MQLLVSDTTIFIDLQEGRLLKTIFQLPYQWMVPDILYEEELTTYRNLVDLGLQIGELNSHSSMPYVVKLVHQYKKPSRNDCFALALAKQEQCRLLTGDKDLRKAAEKEDVTVSGTIWIVNPLKAHTVITNSEAQKAYKMMRDNHRRLPWAKT